jgi:hypothetical protein
MKAEHWTSEDGTDHTLIRAGMSVRERATHIPDMPVKCCEIAGDSWEDCLRAYHRHMGWEEWEPVNEKEPPEGAAGEGDGG